MISSNDMRELIHKYNCIESYVWLILNDKREQIKNNIKPILNTIFLDDTRELLYDR